MRIIAGCWSGGLEEFLDRLIDVPEHETYRAVVPYLHAALLARMTPVSAAEEAAP